MRVLVVGLGFVVACTSSGTPLSDVGVKVDVTVQDGELAVRASLEDVHAPPPRTELDDSSVRVAVRVRGEEIVLADGAATRKVDAPLMGDEEVVVIVENGDGDYVEASATAPPPFSLTPPTDARASEPITVTWSPTAKDPMAWRGGCDEHDNGPIPMDTGSVTFPAGVVASARCTARLAFSRSRISLPNSNFAQARISITQAFSVDLEVAP